VLGLAGTSAAASELPGVLERRDRATARDEQACRQASSSVSSAAAVISLSSTRTPTPPADEIRLRL
jgi:hypothetical protein